MSKKALKIIRAVKAKRLPRLDLGDCGLTELPPEALECAWVEELILSGNKISDLSPLATLTNLQKLYCSRTQVSDLSPLADLNNLQEFNCSSTKVSDLSPLAPLVNLRTLSCSSTQVSDLSPITSLVNLQELYCDSTKISDFMPLAQLVNLQKIFCPSTQVSDLSPLAGLVNLQIFNCASTQVNDLSPLAGLINLQGLNCFSTQVSDLSPIARIVNLQRLYCNKTQVSDLSPLAGLVNLQQLDCNETQVSDLSPLARLVNLQQLDCYSTQVSDLSPLASLVNLQQLSCNLTKVSDLSPLAGLVNLKQLNCFETDVSDLSPLAGLVNLQTLYCFSTQISDLSPLAQLINLQTLYCFYTPISDLSPIAGLVNLQTLFCNSTQVSDLMPLAQVVRLQELDCNSTQVSDLSPLAPLVNLRTLNCSETQVSDLSPLKSIMEEGVVVKWDRWGGHGIFVQDCPLQNPPVEIAKQGNEAILHYWEEAARSGTQKVNEARLLLVGQGQAGKTTLKEKLRDRRAAMPEPDATTKTIHIEPLLRKDSEGTDFVLQVWDFGGQNIQKYAHQFFMSDSVVYAREQNPNFQYWLNIIELLGKDSPFFIVQNEKDGHLEPLKNITQIQERFPNTFQSVEQVNLKNAETDPRFDILERRLLYAATQLPHAQKEYPVSFLLVRRALENLSETQQTISFKQFKELCKSEGISNPELMNDYARTFTSLGIALRFDDDLQLKNQVFLRPKWIIDALFGLLYAPVVEAQNGRFSDSDAENIWTGEEYEDMHGVLLQLMLRFKLCYALPSGQDYIVPQRLPTRTEPFVPPTDATHLIYRYRFLPSGILTQLTCTLHTRIEGNMAWNDAVQFCAKNGQGRVFVRENNSENSIEVFGFDPDKTDLLNTVVDAIDEIHHTSKFGNLKVEKLVPCPCATCAAARTKQEPAEFFDYDFLLELLRDGERESDRCKLSKKKFPIRDILQASNIRAFNMELVRDLLGNDQIEEALRLLRGQFPDDNEIVVQLSRITYHGRMDRMGQMSDTESNKERTRIIKGVLDMLAAWEQDKIR
jgi:Leucine-rich repeat (LRR) protein/GTPase SAR1 family protein